MPSWRVHVRVSVLGPTGNIGLPLSLSLARQGHEVRGISRGRSDRNGLALDELEAGGIPVVFEPDLTDVAALARRLAGSDVVVVASRASPRILETLEPSLLEAASKAAVGRFVPSEFGTHSLAVPYGVSGQFDSKKRFQELLFDSGLGWTIVYGGGIAEFFVPNLRTSDTVEILGDTAVAWPTHLLSDIGAVSALAVTDERTMNAAVQLWAQLVSWDELIDGLREAWPQHAFEVKHVTSEELEHLHQHANPDPGERRLSEREIMGIAYANFVLHKLGDPDFPGTLNANDLYPDYAYRDPRELLSDPVFVFGNP